MQELTYHQEGDYLIPDLALAPEDEEITLGKYGMIYKKHLKENDSLTFETMRLDGTLWPHLAETERQVQEMVESLIKQMATTVGVTEELKARDMMAWVGAMNNIKARAEEIALNELVYNN